MSDEYRHDGGSNRAGDGHGNLIGWFVYRDGEGEDLGGSLTAKGNGSLSREDG